MATRIYLRAFVFGSIGAVLGYWLLPLLSPQLLTVQLAWVFSRPVLLVTGLTLGGLYGFRPNPVLRNAFLAGSGGMLIGRLISLPAVIVINLLWYDFIGFQWPRNTILLNDIASLATWLALTMAGVIVGRRLARSRRDNTPQG